MSKSGYRPLLDSTLYVTLFFLLLNLGKEASRFWDPNEDLQLTFLWMCKHGSYPVYLGIRTRTVGLTKNACCHYAVEGNGYPGTISNLADIRKPLSRGYVAGP